MKIKAPHILNSGTKGKSRTASIKDEVDTYKTNMNTLNKIKLHSNRSIGLVALLQDSWSCLPFVMTRLEAPKVALKLFNYRAIQTSKI